MVAASVEENKLSACDPAVRLNPAAILPSPVAGGDFFFFSGLSGRGAMPPPKSPVVLFSIN